MHVGPISYRESHTCVDDDHAVGSEVASGLVGQDLGEPSRCRLAISFPNAPDDPTPEKLSGLGAGT